MALWLTRDAGRFAEYTLWTRKPKPPRRNGKIWRASGSHLDNLLDYIGESLVPKALRLKPGGGPKKVKLVEDE